MKQIDNKNWKKFNKMLLLLNLNKFKIKKCRIKDKHNEIYCCFYHNKKDKRRNINIINNNLILCKNYKKCIKKDNCNLSHNIVEILYHPNYYKKKFCKNYVWKGKCKYNKFCSFAHSEEELNIKLIHKIKQNFEFFLFYFKTEFCPLGIIKHELNSCVYSHNYQDFKRINLIELNPKKCKNWNLNKNYINYDEDCKNGLDCKYIHGWKEFLFHPYFLKEKNKNINENFFKWKEIYNNLYHNGGKKNLKNIYYNEHWNLNIKRIY